MRKKKKKFTCSICMKYTDEQKKEKEKKREEGRKGAGLCERAWIDNLSTAHSSLRQAHSGLKLDEIEAFIP